MADGRIIPLTEESQGARGTAQARGALGNDAERAVERAQQLAAIDPDWNCPWPLDWQRHYKVLFHTTCRRPVRDRQSSTIRPSAGA
jgi:hypothetical protein